MTTIDFPANPAVDDQVTIGDRTWVWTGIAWESVASVTVPGPVGPTGPQGLQGDLSNLNAVSPITFDGIDTLGFAGIAVDDLTDVTSPSPSNGDTLRWNGTAWVNSELNLDSLTDIQISGTPIVGDTIVYDGTAWVNASTDLTPTFMMMGA